MVVVKLAGIVTLAVAALAPPSFEPAHLREGRALPSLPRASVGGGEVWLELSLGSGGQVEEVAVVRATPPFTDALKRSVERWRFEAAREDGQAVTSRVLVMGMFRPPTLGGPSLGEPPRDVAGATSEVAVPAQVPMPPYPANAVGEATVLVEAMVGVNGHVSELRRIAGAEPFASTTLDTVRDWRFTPATRAGAAVPAVVCVVVGFRAPIVAPPPVAPTP